MKDSRQVFLAFTRRTKHAYSSRDNLGSRTYESIHSSAPTGEMLACTSAHEYHAYGPNFVWRPTVHPHA